MQQSLSKGVASVALGLLFLVNLCITASLTDVAKGQLFENVPSDVWTGILMMLLRLLLSAAVTLTVIAEATHAKQAEIAAERRRERWHLILLSLEQQVQAVEVR
mmetsp:Transcript_91841/g.182451  ORF Transcript_91841/g.182451 Transcript_91841/m.182451 type:complete len:104 (-) Transcript_91841:187-498(-)|eukprot:CAMPEP_0172816164 /NCGR_PEP_ID=MMETSP1075-20121228/12267_1 /TAXON_ID=2916 /ORGANISM="Ceratium fusus, Strain PA161109" /LENGTH=103 /DNA_ID=CAMNT_0013656113 /DNA_START=76 /DNA_END=387 /DNA_ORIENTATION=-